MNDLSPDAASAGGVTVPGTTRSLRIWPAMILIALIIVTRYGPAYLEGGLSVYWMIAVFGPILCSLLLLIWWLTASRATWKERLFGSLGLIGSLAVISALSDTTIRGADTFNITLPMGMMAFALGAALLRSHRPTMRTGVALLFAQLTAQELWTSRNLKPDFTDLVTYQGCAYGIDGGIFTCIDLKTGDRKWKAGRYGKGQVLLLENSGLLLIAAEDGRVVLLRADPSEHAEVASFKALEGKTWNHPVVVGDRHYLRNSQQAVRFQLPLAEIKPSGN